jgi:TPR repeat protein
MSADNLKAPSQIFKWFEKMKENYDKNILAILQRFEQNSNLQQSRIDETHRSHISVMRESHLTQVNQYHDQLEQQRQEIDYFKQQIAQQQQTISQLNNRYDAVIVELIANKPITSPFKDIFDDNSFIDSHEPIISPASTTTSIINNKSLKQSTRETLDCEANIENLYLEALEMRKIHNNQQAFNAFKDAANFGHALAMGAVGRAYFLAEGVEENHSLGLAWLINAAKLNLPQAIKRVEYFRANEPTLYQDALTISKEISKDLLTSADTLMV